MKEKQITYTKDQTYSSFLICTKVCSQLEKCNKTTKNDFFLSKHLNIKILKFLKTMAETNLIFFLFKCCCFCHIILPKRFHKILNCKERHITTKFMIDSLSNKIVLSLNKSTTMEANAYLLTTVKVLNNYNNNDNNSKVNTRMMTVIGLFLKNQTS